MQPTLKKSDQNSTSIIYMDHHATTPVDPRVFDEMKPFFVENFGNPSSTTHPYGWKAQYAVEKSRKQIASLIGANPKEIFFTSGATESNNLALQGFKFSNPLPHVITTNAEHSSVLKTLKKMQASQKIEVSYLSVDKFGQINAAQIEKSIKPNTELISIIFANNEIGTINPIYEIGLIAKKYQLTFHTDFVQAVGKEDIQVKNLNIHMGSLSGHKIYGPKGIGAIYLSHRNPTIEISPLFFGGEQEKEIRPGTLNVPGIVGFGVACELCQQHLKEESERLRNFRDLIISRLQHEINGLIINGHPTERLCNNINLSIPNILPDLIFSRLKNIAFSSGSACTSGTTKKSHVLEAIGLSNELTKTTLRLGLGRFTTHEEVEILISSIIKATHESHFK